MFFGSEEKLNTLKYVVPQEWDGVKAQLFLKQYVGLSSRMIAKLKRVPKGIQKNGELCRTIDLLKAGERIILTFPDEFVYVEEQDIPIDVVYEDEYVVVVNKPAGLVIHPSGGKKMNTLANALTAYYRKKGETHAFHPVNRLDKNTSGLVLVAKTSHIAYALSGKCKKKYYALVEGKLENEGCINQPIRRQEESVIVQEVGEGGKPSVTHWKAIKSNDNFSLVELELETGRTHQIRVHMSWKGNPLLGDSLYGGNTEYINRHALHCYTMNFFHPIFKKNVSIEVDFPQDMQEIVQLL